MDKYNNQLELLNSTLNVLKNQISTLSCDINRAHIDGKSVHYANNIKQQIHFVKEELEEIKEKQYLNYITALTDVFRQHSILHSQAYEFWHNDGKIDKDELKMLRRSLRDLRRSSKRFENVIIKLAGICLNIDEAEEID